MTCDFLNKSLDSFNTENVSSGYDQQKWVECYRGLDEYRSDEELAHVYLFGFYPDALLNFAAACTILFMIIGIPGNIITIVALSKYRKIRNATAIFIINLSVSDLLYASTIFPIAISMFINKSWTAGKFMCRFYPTMNYGLTAASVFTIVAITVNRYVMVSHPVLYPKLYQRRNLIIMIIAIWVGAFSMGLPILFEIWGRYGLDPEIGFCSVIQDKNHNTPKTPIVVMGFVFPSVCIIVCYSRIMYLVRKSVSKSTTKPPTSNVHSNTTSRNQEVPTRETTSSGNTQEDDITDEVETNTNGTLTKFKNKFKATFRRRPRRVSILPTRRDKRLQTMIMAIMISFFTCHIPILIAKTTSKQFAMGPYGHITGYILMYMTVCSNPIIYVVMSKEYRQAYMHVFGFLNKR